MKRLITRRTAGKLGLAALAAPHFATTVVGQAAPDQDRLQHGHDRRARAQRQVLAARDQRIWEEDVNAKGGLLGRKVQVIFRDDQSNPSTVPGIYAQLLDVEKVDLIMGGYATVPLAPTLPVAMQRKKLFIGLLGSGRQFRNPLSELFRDDSIGSGSEAVLHQGLHRSGDEAKPAAGDRRHRGGRRRVLAECRRRRA